MSNTIEIGKEQYDTDLLINSFNTVSLALKENTKKTLSPLHVSILVLTDFVTRAMMEYKQIPLKSKISEIESIEADDFENWKEPKKNIYGVHEFSRILPGYVHLMQFAEKYAMSPCTIRDDLRRFDIDKDLDSYYLLRGNGKRRGYLNPLNLLPKLLSVLKDKKSDKYRKKRYKQIFELYTLHLKKG